ncbi:MAG TPA: FAD-linked oxidase C-terminal domain-containing protein [Acidimicrobiales bacterium]|nr:FAD-linked oxidase C-terminal domain-containing protein [Acidimicrobiales bacterium]
MESSAPDLSAALGVALSAVVRGSVRFDTATRAVYSADASNYRHVPVGVVQPRDADDVLAALEVCRAHDAAVLARGAGTSIGGQSVNAAVVMDLSRHLNRVIDIDPAGRTAVVEPGLVLDELRRQTSPHGLTFGPDPSTHSRCTLGGMIGNNACGSHSVAWGKTVDNVRTLDVVTYDGTRMTVGPTSEEALTRKAGAHGPEAGIWAALREVRDSYGAAVAAGFPDLNRRVSGYNLDQLLAERGFDVARALVGSEGTCAVVLEATVALVATPGARALTVLGFPDAATAADHVVALLEHRPLAMEGIDAGLVAALRAARPDEAVTALLPPGGGWLYVEMGGDTRRSAEAAATAVASSGERLGATSLVVSDPAAMRRLWQVREDGAGIVTRLPGGGEAWPGWEDAAVPPARLGGYLREFSHLLAAHGLHGAYYGHFGDGCVHIRIDFDLLSGEGVHRFRSFVEAAADLVAAHGGSLSGEHGDGQARAELLPRMYPPRIIEAFGAFKAVWDPRGRMNPGRVVAPLRLDSDLRVRVGRPAMDLRTELALHADGGDFARATRRCVGVGKCLAGDGGVMCPSWRVTGEERHSTRGRARLLFEMASGQLVDGGWRSEEVRESLDLCLSCKGCKRECPVSVDMATYKAEFLSHHYAGRVRPAAHYSMGWLPLWLRGASRVPNLANAAMGGRLSAKLLRRLGGIAPERRLPELAPEPFVRWFARRPTPAPGAGAAVASGGAAGARRVVVLPDTFTNFFDPSVGQAAVRVLEALGYRVEVPTRPVCCGLTWLSTGQLGMARRALGRTARVLRPWVDDGVALVGLEPSCTALLRADAIDVLPDDPTVARLGGVTRTLAEIVAAHPGGVPAGIARAGHQDGRRALAQVHCHQHADLGFDPDRAVLERVGVDLEVLDAGCCGLAGNFGFEKGHYAVSMACAERGLLPAVRTAGQDVDVLADGFSCRTQVRQATTRRPVHLAELLADVWGLSPSR